MGAGYAGAGGAAHFPGGGLTPASDARAVSASGCSSSLIRASGSSSDVIHRYSHNKIATNGPFAFGSFWIVPELTNRQIVLRRRPVGLVQPGDTELVAAPAPEPAEGEALVRTTYVGLDAAVRTWLNDQPGYLPPVQLGEVIRAAGIGEVVSSRCDAYAAGDVITTLTGFQEYVIVRDDVFSTPIPGESDQLAIMSVYGPTGATAYIGMTDVGRPQAGDTVVVSAAAGATGSVAGQIAKIAGARVVGIAGGPEKCRAVVEDFGFDACIDYKNDDLDAALKEHCPKRVNVYYDNVGGPILDAVLGRLAQNARVVLCGVISSYLTGEHPGPANYVNLLAKTATMQGFNALDQWGRFDEAFAALRQWEHEGRIKHRQTIFEGIESCVDALNGLFTGANIGKMLVKLSEPTTA
jgi:NADPH-dependent curcumin reductase CurA